MTAFATTASSKTHQLHLARNLLNLSRNDYMALRLELASMNQEAKSGKQPLFEKRRKHLFAAMNRARANLQRAIRHVEALLGISRKVPA